MKMNMKIRRRIDRGGQHANCFNKQEGEELKQYEKHPELNL